MGRSVSVPLDALDFGAVAYRETAPDSKYWWDEPLDHIRDVAKHQWPSFCLCDEWVGREDHAILENEHAYLGVSEYCGLTAVWLVPKRNSWGETSPLSLHWLEQIRDPFVSTFGTLVRVGSFSNGEAIFQQKE